MKWFTVIVALALAISAEGSERNSSETTSALVREDSGTTGAGSSTMLLHIKTRNSMVTVYTGPNGLRYTVKDSKGKTLVADATEKELEDQNPEIYRIVEKAWASQDASWRPLRKERPMLHEMSPARKP